jgi:hypothetical protein
MTKNGFCCVMMFLAVSVLLFSVEEASAAAGTAKATKTSCLPCHADIMGALPKSHPATKGEDIASCLGCHPPDFSGKAEPRTFSARLHRAHGGEKSKTDCLTCHTWVAKKGFGLFKQKGSWGMPSKEDYALLKKTVNAWAGSSYLDDLHGRKNVTCSGCHGGQLPREDDTVENSRCLSCHGGAEKLAEKTKNSDDPRQNPHKSHLGGVNCTVCHKSHGKSLVYCLGCHTQFKMKIPGGDESPQGSVR